MRTDTNGQRILLSVTRPLALSGKVCQSLYLNLYPLCLHKPKAQFLLYMVEMIHKIGKPEISPVIKYLHKKGILEVHESKVKTLGWEWESPFHCITISLLKSLVADLKVRREEHS